MASSFAYEEDSGKTAFELEAKAERFENSVLPAADRHERPEIHPTSRLNP